MSRVGSCIARRTFLAFDALNFRGPRRLHACVWMLPARLRRPVCLRLSQSAAQLLHRRNFNAFQRKRTHGRCKWHRPLLANLTNLSHAGCPDGHELSGSSPGPPVAWHLRVFVFFQRGAWFFFHVLPFLFPQSGNIRYATSGKVFSDLSPGPDPCHWRFGSRDRLLVEIEFNQLVFACVAILPCLNTLESHYAWSCKVGVVCTLS